MYHVNPATNVAPRVASNLRELFLSLKPGTALTMCTTIDMRVHGLTMVMCSDPDDPESPAVYDDYAVFQNTHTNTRVFIPFAAAPFFSL